MRSLSLLAAFLVCAPPVFAIGFSVSGPGGAIPDPLATPGTWNVAYSGTSFTSSVTLAHPVASVSSVLLSGLSHDARGDLHVLLHGPQGTSWNLVVRPGFDGTNNGDSGDLSLGDYLIVESGGADLAQGSVNLSGGSYDQSFNSGAGAWSNGVLDMPLSAISGPSGTWTLEIRDWRPQSSGALVSWTLNGVRGGFATYCYGTGAMSTDCPCQLNGIAGRGCPNSSDAYGAGLVAEGLVALQNVAFHSSGEPANALTLLLQGTGNVAGGALFGDGLRCVSGGLRRLYLRNAVNGIFEAPIAGEASVSDRSAQLGDTIPTGAARYYQAAYRDPSGSFCPPPAGSSFNITNAVAITW